MNILIVDDERPARAELRFLLETVWKEAKITEADSAQSAVKMLEQETYQAIFLDINLGEIKGTTLAGVIRSQQPQAGIIFVTAYQEYALQAFDLDAVDYILKPFDEKRVEKALQKLEKRGYLKESAHREEEERMNRLAVNGGDRILLLSFSEIVYVEANLRTCQIHTTDHKTYEEHITLSHLMEKLVEGNFYRIHKSYVVNLDYVEEIVPAYNNGYALTMKYYKSEELPISRGQIMKIRELFTVD